MEVSLFYFNFGDTPRNVSDLEAEWSSHEFDEKLYNYVFVSFALKALRLMNK